MDFLFFYRVSLSGSSEAMSTLFSFEFLVDIVLEVGLIFLGYFVVFGAGSFSEQFSFESESRLAILSTAAGKSL